MERLASLPGLLSFEEYLELDQSSTTKYEYIGGTVHALAGGSDRHNRIAINVLVALREAAKGSPCRVYISDMRLEVGEVSYYPDVMVACEAPEGENPVVRRDPCVLVEVLSPSTQSVDRREKVFFYQGIPTLRAYLIIDQSARHVERHFRNENGAWQRGDLVNEGSFPVPCPGTMLTLSDIYEGL